MLLLDIVHYNSDVSGWCTNLQFIVYYIIEQYIPNMVKNHHDESAGGSDQGQNPVT